MSRILAYHHSGVETFLTGLLKGIQQIGSSHEFLLFMGPDQNIPTWLSGQFQVLRVDPRTNSAFSKFYWDHRAVGRVCEKKDIDALYAPAHIKPIYTPCPVVVNVLDMMYHRFPEYWKWSDQTYFRLCVSNLTPRSTRVSALSENTKRDLLEFTNIQEGIIKVIYPGVPDGFRVVPPAISGIVREKYNLRNPFILYIGSFHPRKGIKYLIESFEIISNDVMHDLVILGNSRWKNEECEQQIRESQLYKRMHILKGIVPTSELPLFLNEADLFIFPSLYEGFGFPVLEALACGCPTITTTASSLPEVAGDAAILIAPKDSGLLSEEMYKVLSNTHLRSSMHSQSLLQASKFTWENTAIQTIRLLETAVLDNQK